MPKAKDKNEHAVRVTVTIPISTKRRMNAVTEPINWSAIATKAFEDKLAELAARKEAVSDDDAIARLRSVKRQTVDASFREGQEAGLEWAKRRATTTQLDQLEKLNLSSHQWNAMAKKFPGRALGYKLLQRLDSVVYAEPEEQERFWDEANVNDASVDDRQFVEGFVDGAAGYWRRVRTLVEE